MLGGNAFKGCFYIAGFQAISMYNTCNYHFLPNKKLPLFDISFNFTGSLYLGAILGVFVIFVNSYYSIKSCNFNIACFNGVNDKLVGKVVTSRYHFATLRY